MMKMNDKGTIGAVCISPAKGTEKTNAKSRLDTATTNARAAKAQIDELLSWVDCFDAADIGVKHMIIARLVERVEVRTGYKVSVKFKISLDQYLGNKSA